MQDDQSPKDTTTNTTAKAIATITRKDVKTYFGNLVKEILQLDKGVDKWGTINEVKAKQSMSGANAWMLMCSIMIASIGLNLNSQAVIIGAMLISPLMSPILGIGVAVGINDKDALYNALMHFGAAIIIALLSSTLYFAITPLDDFTEQIQARTEPTFLDVLIAVFGGIAGIVSIARKDISTTLPGVAIATALMPPLCVTGYGIANLSFDIASKSFYLFFLNSFFVALATYIIVRYLRFPHKKYSSPQDRRKNIFIVGLISLVMTIPSFIIFSKVFNKFQEEQKINSFITQYIGKNNIYLDDHKLLKLDDGSSKLILKVYGDSISKNSKAYYEQGLRDLNLNNTRVEIIPTSEINLSRVRQLESQLSEVGNKINNQIVELNKEREDRMEMFEQVEQQNDFFSQDSILFHEVCRDVKVFLPEIEEIDLAITMHSDFQGGSSKLPMALVKWDQPTVEDKEKLYRYLLQKFSLDTLKVVVVN